MPKERISVGIFNLFNLGTKRTAAVQHVRDRFNRQEHWRTLQAHVSKYAGA